MHRQKIVRALLESYLDALQCFLNGLGRVHHVPYLALTALLRQVHRHAVVLLVQGAQVQPVPALHIPIIPCDLTVPLRSQTVMHANKL